MTVKSSIKKIAVNASLVVGSLLVTLVVLELVMALFFPQKVYLTSAPDIFFVKHDPILGWVNKENVQQRYTPGGDVPATDIAINGEGFRGREVNGEGKPRILFLGDSNTFGYGVEEKERFSDLFARKTGGKYEVINVGVFGYGTDQEALLLERDIKRYSPKLVILGFSAGDLSDNITSVNGGAAKPYFSFTGDTLSLQNVPVPMSSPYMKSKSARSRFKSFLYKNSHLYRLVISRLAVANKYASDSVVEMTTEEGLEVTATLLQGMKDLCQENGAELVVVLIPHGMWLEGRKKAPQAQIGYYAALHNMLGALGIPFVDPDDLLMREAREPVFFQKDPVHLTRRGNQVVAEALYSELTKRQLLPD